MLQLLEGLKSTQTETLGYFDLPTEALARTYAPGKWTAKQLLHHLADAETVLYERIRRGIAKPGQVVWGFHQDDWCQEMDYAHEPLDLNREIYRAVRNNIIRLAEKYYGSHGANAYVHSETGLRTVKDEFDKVVWHNEHHLQQIRQALHP